MGNWDTNTAREYHEATKHRPGLVESRRVDPRIIPRPYKLYLDLPSVALPPSKPPPATAAERRLDLGGLSAIIHYSAGIIRRRAIAGKEVEFRAAACTGALYHIELYVVAGAVEGLDPGVYHYSVQDESLRQLRAGDFRAVVAEAAAVPHPRGEAMIALTSVFWRNAWRYEDRSYRHVFW